PPDEAAVEWLREPSDRETELPDRVAFDGNLARLLAATSAAPRGGVLLVSVDEADRLRRRIGDGGVAAIRRSVARVLCRAIRDGDLACRLDEGTFAVLFADPEPADAVAQAAAVREAFRGHPFRTGPDGPELLVTASFGFTPALPGDEPRLLLDRGRAAVARSRRWGRNRLHVYEPQSGRFSQASDLAGTAQRPAGVPA
ncbi:MAG TPA: GGDEF domain-containing protein, partial [Planctomycetaceae bacterium]